MQNFRTVCIMNKKEDSFDAYYLREFFKWIGLSYFDYCYDGTEENYILKNPENNNFDIFVLLNYENALIADSIKNKIMDCRVYTINTSDYKKDVDMLWDLFSKFYVDIFHQNNWALGNSVFKKMIDIYEKNHMVGMLYQYTFTLLSKKNWKSTQQIYDIYMNILQHLESLYRILTPGTPGIENCLYAILHSRAKINELCEGLGRLLKFDIEVNVEEANKLYEYDKDFFRAEYLKVKFLIRDDVYRPFARKHIEQCIEKCPVKTCKSYHYYCLGKYLEENRKRILAVKNYQCAYKKNNKNIKALFKLAQERYGADDYEDARKKFEQIISFLDVNIEDGTQGNRKDIAPMNLEYIFKCYMILGSKADGIGREECYKQATKILDYLKDAEKIIKNKQGFIYKMYVKHTNIENFCQEICQASVMRLGTKRLETNC